MGEEVVCVLLLCVLRDELWSLCRIHPERSRGISQGAAEGEIRVGNGLCLPGRGALGSSSLYFLHFSWKRTGKTLLFPAWRMCSIGKMQHPAPSFPGDSRMSPPHGCDSSWCSVGSNLSSGPLQCCHRTTGWLFHP